MPHWCQEDLRMFQGSKGCACTGWTFLLLLCMPSLASCMFCLGIKISPFWLLWKKRWNSAFPQDSGNINEPFLLALRDSYLKQETRELWKLFPTCCYWSLAWYQWRPSFCDWINYLGMDFCLSASWESHFTVPWASSTHWQKPDFPAGCLTTLAWLLSKCWLGAGSPAASSILLAWDNCSDTSWELSSCSLLFPSADSEWQQKERDYPSKHLRCFFSFGIVWGEIKPVLRDKETLG